MLSSFRGIAPPSRRGSGGGALRAPPPLPHPCCLAQKHCFCARQGAARGHLAAGGAGAKKLRFFLPRTPSDVCPPTTARRLKKAARSETDKSGGRSRPYHAIPRRESLPCRPSGLWVGSGEARAVQAALPSEAKSGGFAAALRRSRLAPQVRLADVVAPAKLLAGTGEHDLAGFQHVGAVAQPSSAIAGVLLNQQDGGAAAR